MKLGIEIEGTWLTPVKFSHTDKTGTFYWFRCRCGTEKLIRKGNVFHNKKKPTKSCGCRKRQVNKEHPDIGFKKGHKPWHSGKKVGAGRLGRHGGGYNKGKMMFRQRDGSIKWIDKKAKLPPDTGGISMPGERPRG